ncbi:MAG: type I-D CRISPR-associated endonuclease Cas1 [Coleofasciculaceae cyanobacterium RL_1_1]|nr:type I-D CRISPR-associated endonuclease Cas1 [Coleofasciculaceae cyanobacterium RL_1_1]
MGTVYITTEDSFIGKTDERLTVRSNGEKLLDVPLLKIDGLVVLGRSTLSPAVVSELLDRQIPLSFLTVTGKFRGRLEPELTKNIFVRRSQWAAAGETEQAVHVVRGFIRGKLKNYRSALQRSQRDYPEQDLSHPVVELKRMIDRLDREVSIDVLRGLEGAGSAVYFGCFGQLLRNPEFTFPKRSRRPPTDPVNALLSFGYALLRHDIQGAVNIVGFDPYLGYLHLEHYGRPSLALDLMEEFRPLVVDAMVLSALNRQQFKPDDFQSELLSGAVKLTDEGRKRFLRFYEQKKQSEFKHPVMKRKCNYREAFEIQARLLSKYLMGQTEVYPPLILK